MLPKSESNESQRSTPLVLEESKAKRDLQSDDLPTNSTQTGTNDLVHLLQLWIEAISSATPALLAWSSEWNNKIRIVDLETKQEFSNFDGVDVSKPNGILNLL